MHNINFTYCPINLYIDSVDLMLIKDEVTSLNENYWHQGFFKNLKVMKIWDDFEYWTNAGHNMQSTKEIISEKVFTIFPRIPRIRILKIVRNYKMGDHSDCSDNQIRNSVSRTGIRISLTENTDKFYFITTDNTKKYIPNKFKTYAINMCHPHGCDESEEDKITVSFPLSIMDNEYIPTDSYLNSLDMNHMFKIDYPNNIDDFSVNINKYKNYKTFKKDEMTHNEKLS